MRVALLATVAMGLAAVGQAIGEGGANGDSESVVVLEWLDSGSDTNGGDPAVLSLAEWAQAQRRQQYRAAVYRRGAWERRVAGPVQERADAQRVEAQRRTSWELDPLPVLRYSGVSCGSASGCFLAGYREYGGRYEWEFINGYRAYGGPAEWEANAWLTVTTCEGSQWEGYYGPYWSRAQFSADTWAKVRAGTGLSDPDDPYTVGAGVAWWINALLAEGSHPGGTGGWPVCWWR
jgi:hypothetical protein